MDPTHYLILNGIVVIIIVLSVLRRKSNSDSIHLNLRKTSDRRPQTMDQFKKEAEFFSGSAPSSPPEDDGARSLNLIFEFEGQWYDAYEVLGLPAGSAYPQVKEQFEHLIRTVGSDRALVLKKAFDLLSGKN